MTTPLTKEVKFRISLLFQPNEIDSASELLANECGNNLPFCSKTTPAGLNRVRIAALKLSEGKLAKLREAVDLAKSDWRDLLVAAGFANDLHAHEEWLPDGARGTLPPSTHSA
jgi:hypothetical protein